MPSIRIFARQHNVSINSAIRCYQFLEEKQFISVKAQSGYFVLPVNTCSEMPLPQFKSRVITPSLTSNRTAGVVTSHPFNRAQISPELLPVASLNKCLANTVRSLPVSSILYGDNQGALRLRQALSQHFKKQGFAFDAQQLIINNGCLDGIKIAIELISNVGDCLVISSPCFNGLLELLSAMKRKVIEVPSTKAGLDLKQITRLMASGTIAGCLLTANHQNPLGQSLSNEQKQTLAELSNLYRVPIIEDDVYQELHYFSTMPLPIKYYDRQGTVIWCSSISKTLASGYRIGWVLPGCYFNEFLYQRSVQTLGINQPLQLALAAFIDKQGYGRHLRRLQHKLYKQVMSYRNFLLAGFNEVTTSHVSLPDGGIVLWVYVEGLDAQQLLVKTGEQGVYFRPGNVFSCLGVYQHYFRINAGYPLTPALEDQLRFLIKTVIKLVVDAKNKPVIKPVIKARKQVLSVENKILK